jgi:hypothetical protein
MLKFYVDLMASVNKPPQATVVQVLNEPTCFGEDLFTVVPSPI